MGKANHKIYNPDTKKWEFYDSNSVWDDEKGIKFEAKDIKAIKDLAEKLEAEKISKEDYDVEIKKLMEVIGTKAEKKDIPTSIGQLTNDKGYITKSEVPKVDLSGVNDRISKLEEEKADKGKVVTSVNGKTGNVTVEGKNYDNEIRNLQNTKADKDKIGVLSNLKTGNKDNLVEAINELQGYKQDKPILYGIKIDETNSNPETAVTYIGMNKDFIPADGIKQTWGSWKPFVDKYLSEYVTLDLETKKETQRIDPYNWTKTIDGKTAILDGSKGDLMWKVPKLYWKFERIGTDLYIYLATMQVDDDYVCLAHTKGNEEMDYIYYSVMLGTEKSGKLRSIDGGTPTDDKTIGAFRTLCEANGDNVHMLPYYPWLLYQIIVLMLGKNRDTQTQFGNNQSSDRTNVAKNLSKGIIYGQSAKGSGVNLFIADPWGNQRFWIDGMKYDGSYNILVGTDEFNNNATGYENVGKTKFLSGYIDGVHGTTKSGFVPTSTSGSNTTHYADYGYVNSGWFPCAGGIAGFGLRAGAFYWSSDSASYSDSTLSARIFVYGL